MAAGDYYSQAQTKLILGIASGDTSEDSELDQFGNKGDRQVDNDLSWHLDSFPVAAASITDDLTAAANAWTAYLYKLFKKDLESAREYRTLYKDIIEGVKQRLISTTTGRTQRKSITKDYLSEPLLSSFDEGLS